MLTDAEVLAKKIASASKADSKKATAAVTDPNVNANTCVDSRALYDKKWYENPVTPPTSA
jgi:hypothetical protein